MGVPLGNTLTLKNFPVPPSAPPPPAPKSPPGYDLVIKMWGAGGSSADGSYGGSSTKGAGGGAGGYMCATMPWSKVEQMVGDTLSISVGQGGKSPDLQTPGDAFGGGGQDNYATTSHGGNGGGYSAIFSTGSASQSATILMAGGGGGGNSYHI